MSSSNDGKKLISQSKKDLTHLYVAACVTAIFTIILIVASLLGDIKSSIHIQTMIAKNQEESIVEIKNNLKSYSIKFEAELAEQKERIHNLDNRVVKMEEWKKINDRRDK